MKKIAAILLLLVCAGAVRGQDVRVNCSQNSACTLTPTGGLPWSNGNLIFVFRPLDPRVSVYIFIRNLNPTSAHSSQTISVFQTPFSQDSAPSLTGNASRWTQDIVTQNTTAGASCNNVNANNDPSIGASGLGTCYVNTMFAAQVAIRITGANTQAGSPDNFDLAIVQHIAAPGGQTPGASTNQVQGFSASGSPVGGNPVLVGGNSNGNAQSLLVDSQGRISAGAQAAQGDAVGNNFEGNFVGTGSGSSPWVPGVFPFAFNGATWDRVRGTAGTGLSDAPAIQVYSDGLSQAFTAGDDATNPAAGGVLVAINDNSGAKSLYFDKAILSNETAAAVVVSINGTSSVGNCSAGSSIANLKLGNGTASIASNTGTGATCGTPPNPVNASIGDVSIPAGGTVIVDLRGFIAPSASTTGIDIVSNAAVTGRVDAVLLWHEK